MNSASSRWQAVSVFLTAPSVLILTAGLVAAIGILADLRVIASIGILGLAPGVVYRTKVTERRSRLAARGGPRPEW